MTDLALRVQASQSLRTEAALLDGDFLNATRCVFFPMTWRRTRRLHCRTAAADSSLEMMRCFIVGYDSMSLSCEARAQDDDDVAGAIRSENALPERFRTHEEVSS